MMTVRTRVSTDDRIRNGARWARIKRSAGLGLLCAAVVAPFAAESADDLKLPASYRNWYHVNTMVIDKGSPLFEAMGGMHNVYINSTGETALKKGGPYPDKTVLLVDDVLTTGATVEACAQVLQRGGARHVDVLTLARVVRPAL